MPDVTIGSLPKASAVYDDSAFVMEQDGHAVQTDAETLKTYLLELGTNNLCFFGNTDTMAAEKTSVDVFAAVDAKMGVKLYLHGSDDLNYRSADLVRLVFETNASEWIAYFEERETAASSGNPVSVLYALGEDGALTVYSRQESMSASTINTVTGSGRVRLNYEPVENTDAVNKAYVDSHSGNVTAGVNSVNNMSGDVTLDIPDVQVAVMDQYYQLSVIKNDGTTVCTIPTMACYPDILRYDVSGDNLRGGDYSSITESLNNGRTVRAAITCGASTFYVELKRRGYNEENGKNFYSFDYTTYQIESPNNMLWWGSLRVYQDNTTEYHEGTITFAEATS